jgi:Holliday junction resolvasome RuvABC endonuclease subunit
MNIIARRQTQEQNGCVAKRFDITLAPKEYPAPNSYTTFVGIDPGTRNMGLAIFHDLIGRAYEIKLPVAPDRTAGMLLIQATLQYLIEENWADGYSRGRWLIWVEDAAFGMKFGQVQLAESRAASMLYFAPRCSKVSVIPPASIRKMVFGDGRKKAHEVWTSISPNAAAAVSCAIYGMLRCEL